MSASTEALLFDLDGTLIDPKIGITRCVIHALQESGLPAPHPDELHWCIGPPLHESLKKLMGTEDPETIRRAMGLYRERYAREGMREHLAYPGIPEALAELARSRALYVATSKPWPFARPILERLGLASRFRAIHGSELDGTRAKKGDLIRHILATESLAASECAMIGDRMHDLIGARENGVRAYGAAWGYGSEEELLENGAFALIREPRGLVSAFDRN